MFTQKPMSVHSSFIWDSQKLETIQISLTGTVSTPQVSRSHQKGMMVNTCNDLDASPEHYAEKSQFQVGTHCMIPFIQCSRNDKIIEMTTRLVVQDGSRRGGCGSKGWLGGRSWWGGTVLCCDYGGHPKRDTELHPQCPHPTPGWHCIRTM